MGEGFCNHISDERLYLEYVKNSLNFIIKRQITQIVKWAKDLNKTFLQRRCANGK